jgi:TRAP-type uncharacterized transport system substrate-binding protein
MRIRIEAGSDVSYKLFGFTLANQLTRKFSTRFLGARPMPRITTLNYGRAYVFGLVAVAFIGWGLYAAIEALRPVSSVRVRLAAGSSVVRRFQIAETLATDSRSRDLYVEVVPTKGFEDSIRQVANGKQDLAMVSSGLEVAECKDVRVLAGLDIAPLHILARRELVEQGLSLVTMIKGRRVNLGQPGTNDYMLANDIVRFLRLSPTGASRGGDYTLSSLSKEELTQLALNAQAQAGSERAASLQALPDVVMTVVSLPSVLVQNLLDTGAYSLVPFPNVEPFLISELHHVNRPEGSVDRILVEPTVIRAGMYVGDSPTPSIDCATVGLRTLLVARANLSAAAVERVMQGVFETDFTKRVKPCSPREIATAYKIHPAAEKYLDRDKPLITGKYFEILSKFFSIFGAFSAGALSLYGYLRRRRIRRPGEYLEEIRKIDALASGQHQETELPVSPEVLARQVDMRLNQLKEQVIRDYCDNRVQGEMVLLSILSTLADSRSRLHVTTGRSTGIKSAAPHATAPWLDDPMSNSVTGRSAGRAA